MMGNLGNSPAKQRISVGDRDQRNAQRWWGATPVDVMGSAARRRGVRLGEGRGGSLSKTGGKDVKSDNREKIQCEGKCCHMTGCSAKISHGVQEICGQEALEAASRSAEELL